MLFRTAFIALALALVAPTLADEPSTGPLIEGYGPTYPINDRDVPLREDFVYKAVFDIAQDPVEGSVNRNFVSVARFLNMHARNGIDAEKMDLTNGIKIALSAMTMLTILQSDGYALLPWGA